MVWYKFAPVTLTLGVSNKVGFDTMLSKKWLKKGKIISWRKGFFFIIYPTLGKSYRN
jgi:hypothetical protein